MTSEPFGAGDMRQSFTVRHPSRLQMKVQRRFVASRPMDQSADNFPPLTARWLEPENYHPSWEERSRIAVSMMDAGTKAVCDIGCGKQLLRSLLPDGVQYYPADIRKWSDDTELCEINRGLLPVRSIAASDTCFALGVIEYICNPTPLFRAISQARKIFICSYNTKENAPDRNPIWISDFSGEQFLTFARNAGLRTVNVRQGLGSELIFKFISVTL